MTRLRRSMMLLAVSLGCSAAQALGDRTPGADDAGAGGGGARGGAGGGGAPGGRGGSGEGGNGGSASGGASGRGGSGSGGAGASGGSPGSAMDGGARDTGAPTGMSASDGGAPGTGAGGAELFVMTTGNDMNPGTMAAPLKTLYKAIGLAGPGTTIWIGGGVHEYAERILILSPSLNIKTPRPPPFPAKDGEAGKLIRVWAMPGPRPVLDFAQQKRSTSSEVDLNRGIMIWANYWHVKGLEIKNAADNAIHIAGSHNIIENTVTHHNGDTGIQITVPEDLRNNAELGAHNLILNCDSYDNHDNYSWSQGENADGFAAKLRIGPGNVFRGCRAWRNADDGWDLYESDDPVTIEDCWAFKSKPGFATNTKNSDGNGFKLGGGSVKAMHVVSRSFAFDNAKDGFTDNSNPGPIMLTDCGAWNNASSPFKGTGLVHTGDVVLSVTADQAIAVARNADGSLPSLKTVAGR